MNVDFRASATGKLSLKEYVHATRPLYVEKYIAQGDAREVENEVCSDTRTTPAATKYCEEITRRLHGTKRKGRSTARGSKQQRRVTTVRRRKLKTI